MINATVVVKEKVATVQVATVPGVAPAISYEYPVRHDLGFQINGSLPSALPGLAKTDFEKKNSQGYKVTSARLMARDQVLLVIEPQGGIQARQAGWVQSGPATRRTRSGHSARRARRSG